MSIYIYVSINIYRERGGERERGTYIYIHIYIHIHTDNFGIVHCQSVSTHYIDIYISPCICTSIWRSIYIYIYVFYT